MTKTMAIYLEKHEKMMNFRRSQNEDSEDKILDEMDAIWWKMNSSEKTGIAQFLQSRGEEV